MTTDKTPESVHLIVEEHKLSETEPKSEIENIEEEKTDVTTNENKKDETETENDKEKDSLANETEKTDEELQDERQQDKNELETTPVDTVIDLDELVDRWVDYMIEKTNKPKKANCFMPKSIKNKSNKRCKDFITQLNWNDVKFTHEDVSFMPSEQDESTNTSKTLLSTSFANKTSQDQETSFKMERATNQICDYSFCKGFKSKQEAVPSILLPIPEDIVQLDASIKSEQALEAGKDLVTKEEVSWQCNSTVKVKPTSTSLGSLVITELEKELEFSGATFIEGRLIADLGYKKGGVFQSIESLSGDIFQVIEVAITNNWISSKGTIFEVVDKRAKVNFSGKCKFRLGYNQRVELKEEPVEIDA